MIKDTDIAWLAGIVDGEGCFSVKRPVQRGTGRTTYQTWLVVCNTSRAMMDRVAAIIAGLGCAAPRINRKWKGQKATRWQYEIVIAAKHDLLVVTNALLPHLTAKKVEASAFSWFLSRACSDRAYVRTELDKVVLEALSKVKRNGGEAPAEVYQLLREVIPSEAFSGAADRPSENERVETRELSASNNAPHECPAPDDLH